MTDNVHAGNDIAVDETTTNTPVTLNTAPAVGDTNYALPVRPTALGTGSAPCSFTTAAAGLGGSTTEALATLTPVRDFTTDTAATVFTVPTGKTMRVTGFWGVARRTTGTGSITWELEINLHVNTGAAATISSPVVFTGVAAWKELAASTTTNIGTQPVWFEIPGGIELPAGASFALGYRNSGSQPTRVTNEICMTGFEF